jgi:D-amino peptidase
LKIFISCDMEGISGVTAVDDCNPTKDAYQRFRKIMVGDVNAAIEGAFEAGAKEVLVNDSHDGMRNLMIEEIDPRVSLISGVYKPLCMMEGIDKSFDLVMYVGYHAMAGTKAAIMDHTFYGSMIQDVWINDKLVGESGINSGIAGYYGVPVGAVTGDDKVAKEVKTLLGDVETAVVKVALDKYVAKCPPLNESRERIRNAAKKAVERKKDFKPLKFSSPVTFKVRFNTTTEAAVASLLPDTKLVNPRTVAFTRDDYIDAFHLYLGGIGLASTGRDPIFG